MKTIKWYIGAGGVLAATALVLVQTASAGDVIYKAADGADLTAPQATSRLTAAVADVWVGPLTSLSKIDCVKQDSDPVVWWCDHEGTGQAELQTVLTAMGQAAEDPLRRVKIMSRVKGTSQVVYSQWIRGVYTPAQMATRYTTAIAGIWRAAIGGVISLHMRKTGKDATPYRLHIRGVVTSTQADFLTALEQADDYPADHRVH